MYVGSGSPISKKGRMLGMCFVQIPINIYTVNIVNPRSLPNGQPCLFSLLPGINPGHAGYHGKDLHDQSGLYDLDIHTSLTG